MLISEPYITTTTADTLYDQMLPTTVRVIQADANGKYEHNDVDIWQQAQTDGIKEAVLKQATRWIDEHTFDGVKKDDTQELEFPRDFQENVPSEVKVCTFLITLEFLRQHYIKTGFPTLYVQPLQIGATDFYSQTSQSQTSIKTEGYDWENYVKKIFRNHLAKYLRASYPIASLTNVPVGESQWTL